MKRARAWPSVNQRLLLLGCLPPQIRRYHGGENGAQDERSGQKQIGLSVTGRVENPPVDQREHDAEHLDDRVQHTARRALGLRVGQLGRQLVSDGQITGHEEPGATGRTTKMFGIKKMGFRPPYGKRPRGPRFRFLVQQFALPEQDGRQVHDRYVSAGQRKRVDHHAEQRATVHHQRRFPRFGNKEKHTRVLQLAARRVHNTPVRTTPDSLEHVSLVQNETAHDRTEHARKNDRQAYPAGVFSVVLSRSVVVLDNFVATRPHTVRHNFKQQHSPGNIPK